MAPDFLETCSVVVCAGAGGVGKTTTTAALGALAARRGRRVAVVTIDPARRLADSLGLENLGDTPQTVSPECWATPTDRQSPGGERGRLVALMLDTQRTFDDLVVRHTQNIALRDRILNNPLYRQLSTNLAGVHEYMALEKLQELQQDDRFDMVILDTPPARNAVDFLTAPDRLVEALDGKVMQWLTRSLRSRDRAKIGLVGTGISQLLGLMGKITGQGLLEQMAQLIVDLDQVLGGIRKRAVSVSQALQHPSLQFVLVASPQSESSGEAIKLAQYLQSRRMTVATFLMNRVHSLIGSLEADALVDPLKAQLPNISTADRSELAKKISQAAKEAEEIAKHDDRALQMLRGAARRQLQQATPVVFTPVVAQRTAGENSLRRLTDALEACLHRLDDADLESVR